MFLRFITRYFSNDLAIDLGTANTFDLFQRQRHRFGRTFSGGHADSPRHRTTFGFWPSALMQKKMLGRTPGSIKAIRPMKDGVIAEFTVTSDMLKHFIKKVTNSRFAATPRIVICVPCGSTR